MCGRFNQQNVNFGGPDGKYEKKLSRILKSNQRANIAPGMLACIITDSGVAEAEFGFRPAWDPKKLFVNARIEGKGNEGNLKAGWQVGVDSMNSFRKSFASKRCIIPVDSFIEGPEKEKLSRPYLVTTADKRQLYLAGIYNEYNKLDGTEEFSFAILTSPAIPICEKIGHHRSPVMLNEDLFDVWLDHQRPIDEIKRILGITFYEPNMVAYPLDAALIKSGKLHGDEVLLPIREAITA